MVSLSLPPVALSFSLPWFSARAEESVRLFERWVGLLLLCLRNVIGNNKMHAAASFPRITLGREQSSQGVSTAPNTENETQGDGEPD